MAWVAVDKDGIEAIFLQCPKRMGYDRTKLYIPYEETFWSDDDGVFCSRISLPKGSIKKLIGRELSWEDNPVELKEEQP